MHRQRSSIQPLLGMNAMIDVLWPWVFASHGLFYASLMLVGAGSRLVLDLEKDWLSRYLVRIIGDR